MSSGWVKASAYHLQVSLFCAVLCQIVSLQYVSRSSLHRLAGLPCRLYVETHKLHRSSLKRLMCPAQDHFIFLTMMGPCSRKVVLCLFVSVQPQLEEMTTASVQVSTPYVIAGRTQELYTCLFRQMARLLLRRDPGVSYAAQPAMILRCILVLCHEAVALSEAYVAFNIFYHSALC